MDDDDAAVTLMALPEELHRLLARELSIGDQYRYTTVRNEQRWHHDPRLPRLELAPVVYTVGGDDGDDDGPLTADFLRERNHMRELRVQHALDAHALSELEEGLPHLRSLEVLELVALEAAPSVDLRRLASALGRLSGLRSVRIGGSLRNEQLDTLVRSLPLGAAVGLCALHLYPSRRPDVQAAFRRFGGPLYARLEAQRRRWSLSHSAWMATPVTWYAPTLRDWMERAATLGWRRRGQPLVEACRRGDLGRLRALLDGGGSRDPNAPGRHGHLPLTQACVRGRGECVALLLERGAHVDGRVQRSPLLTPHARDCANDAQRYPEENIGRTPLMLAARGGHLACVRCLLDARADASAADVRGVTALHLAAEYGQVECVRELLHRGGARDERGDRLGVRALHLAARHGHLECARLLLAEGGAQLDRPAVELAHLHGHDACLQGMLALVDEPLADAWAAHAMPLGVHASRMDEDDVEELRLHGVDPRHEHLWLDEELYRPSRRRLPPLLSLEHAAERLVPYGLLRLLCAPGGGEQVEQQRRSGEPALLRALRARAHADDEARDQSRARLCVQHLVDFGADVNECERGGRGRNALEVAAEAGKHACLDTLLQAGAERVDQALALAAMHGHHLCVVPLVDAGGADVDCARHPGAMTALMYAAFGGHRQAVRTLLHSRADPSLRSDEGRTAHDYARGSGHDECARLLERFLATGEVDEEEEEEEEQPSSSRRYGARW